MYRLIKVCQINKCICILKSRENNKNKKKHRKNICHSSEISKPLFYILKEAAIYNTMRTSCRSTQGHFKFLCHNLSYFGFVVDCFGMTSSIDSQLKITINFHKPLSLANMCSRFNTFTEKIVWN